MGIEELSWGLPHEGDFGGVVLVVDCPLVVGELRFVRAAGCGCQPTLSRLELERDYAPLTTSEAFWTSAATTRTLDMVAVGGRAGGKEKLNRAGLEVTCKDPETGIIRGFVPPHSKYIHNSLPSLLSLLKIAEMSFKIGGEATGIFRGFLWADGMCQNPREQVLFSRGGSGHPIIAPPPSSLLPTTTTLRCPSTTANGTILEVGCQHRLHIGDTDELSRSLTTRISRATPTSTTSRSSAGNSATSTRNV